jgi:hypothetical protein
MVPVPLVIFSSRSYICFKPTRQGTHWPHDSSSENSRKYLAMLTMQLSSSRTIRPPEPMIEPSAFSDS